MRKVKLGHPGIEITPIVYGAWAIGGWMWGGSDEKSALEAIRESIDCGITSIDTAPIYGFGKSEQLVGEAIKGVPRDKLQILTKFGMRWDTDQGNFYILSEDSDGSPVRIHKYSGSQSIIRECEMSLKRLGTDYIDLYQIHWPDKTTPIEESFTAVEQLIRQGKVRAAGVCNYNVEQMQKAMPVVPLASNQVPYSMVMRDIEKEIVPYCLQHDMGILAYSPLQRGLLTGKITDDYSFNKGDNRADNKFFQQPILGRVNRFLHSIRPIAEKYGVQLSQLVINWTICQPGITAALVGARNKDQVTQNAGALSFEITKQDLSEMTSMLQTLDLA